ncbi:MAG: hypothetical protein M5U13_14810 [Thermoanaerobaculia bacterium]|nr:hypothetical protein [Thermoanaerobaculia bacterium]
MRRRIWTRLLLAGALALGPAPTATAREPEALPVPRPPELRISAPPELAGVAAELARIPPEAFLPGMRLTGLADPGPPIRVALATTGSPAGRAAPPWAAGVARGATGEVTLFPARVRRSPDRRLRPLLQHEVAHVLVARAARGRPVPRWFDEGLAMAAGRALDVGDRARVALAVLSDGRLPLARVDAAFAGHGGDVEAAYALSRDFVVHLLAEFGDDVGARILADVARDVPFPAAFRSATGRPLAEVEADYWRRRTLWDRWLPFATSAVTLWIGITLLALVAFRRRRARTAAIHARWDEEEQERAAERLRAREREDDLVN